MQINSQKLTIYKQKCLNWSINTNHNTFFRLHLTVFSSSFKKFENLELLRISPNTHSTDDQILLMTLLYYCWIGVTTA